MRISKPECSSVRHGGIAAMPPVHAAQPGPRPAPGQPASSGAPGDLPPRQPVSRTGRAAAANRNGAAAGRRMIAACSLQRPGALFAVPAQPLRMEIAAFAACSV